MKKFFTGSTLMEVLIAVGVSSVGLLALIQIGTKAVNNSAFSSRQSAAGQYVSQALERVRERRKQMDWAAFRSQFAGQRCGVDLTASGGCGVPNTEFTSRVTLTFQNPTPTTEEAVVVSEVWWQEGTGGGGPVRQVTVSQQTVIARY